MINRLVVDSVNDTKIDHENYKSEKILANEIMIAGDIHARFHMLNDFLNKHNKTKIILQCGDFGFWPRFDGFKYGLQLIKNRRKTKIFWCDGNHEDHDVIDKLEETEIAPNIFYMPRGSTLLLPDGRNVLFIGGALSIDKKYRTQGVDWFPQETISQKNIYDLPDEKVDIVISHTAPSSFELIDWHLDYEEDPSRKALDSVLEKYKPSLWYFGHMHKFFKGFTKGCKWTGLSGVGLNSDPWIVPLEK